MPRTVEQLRADLNRLYPDRDWLGYCQALVAHAAEITTGKVLFYLSAKEAYGKSKIASMKASKAAVNDVHFWAIGADWHTGVDLGGGLVLMASSHSDGSWGKNLGVTTVAEYNAKSGAVYRGFSHSNGINKIAIAKPKPARKGSDRIRRIAAFLNGEHLGRTTTAAQDGVVDQSGNVAQVYWWLIQAWGIREHKYPLAKGYLHDGKPARTGGLTRKLEAEIDALTLAKQ